MRILFRVVAVLMTLIAAGLLVLLLAYPRTDPPSAETIVRTPQRVARGEYLARDVAFCFNCHSTRDWSRFAGPVSPRSLGGGGSLAFLGSSEGAPNITPYALAAWSDGEVLRAITAGVDRHGRALGPRMPFDRYAVLTLEDARAIVAYLRTLPPLRTDVVRAKQPFAQELFARVRPEPWRPAAAVSPVDRVAYGRYLVGLAGCDFCHGATFAGGRSFPLPDGRFVVSRHVLGKRDRASFIAMFRSLRDRDVPVRPGQRNTVMPWLQYARMSEEDLGAIYDYLKTVAAPTPVSAQQSE